MPSSALDRMVLAGCFALMSLGLRLFRLGRYLTQEQ